jgi:hypothetical protein
MKNNLNKVYKNLIYGITFALYAMCIIFANDLTTGLVASCIAAYACYIDKI